VTEKIKAYPGTTLHNDSTNLYYMILWKNKKNIVFLTSLRDGKITVLHESQLDKDFKTVVAVLKE
jgi:hypothetical protein